MARQPKLRSSVGWCPWPESNQHSLRNSILSRARLPVPPQGPSGHRLEAAVAKPAEYSGRPAPVNPRGCDCGLPRQGSARGVARLPGRTDCSGPIGNLGSAGNLLERLDTVKVVRCDEVQFRFLGLSLAGYNVLISLLMAAIALWGFVVAAKRQTSW